MLTLIKAKLLSFFLHQLNCWAFLQTELSFPCNTVLDQSNLKASQINLKDSFCMYHL